MKDKNTEFLNETQFLDAARNGDFDTVKSLIGKVNIDCTGTYGHTALMHAAYKYKDIVELLVSRGADIHAEYPEEDETALFFAVPGGNKDIILTLLNNGANLNHQNARGETVLIIEARSGNKDAVKFLLENFANVNLKDEYGQSALMHAVHLWRNDVTELLVNYGACIKEAFESASEEKDYISMALLKKDMNQVDKDGSTLLMHACQFKKEESIIFLYNKGADFYLQNDKGESAFSILKRKRKLSPILQSLKEKLILSRHYEEIEATLRL